MVVEEGGGERQRKRTKERKVSKERGEIQSSEKRMAHRSILEGNNEKEKYA